MHTYVLLKNGKIMVLYSDNIKEETMHVYDLDEIDVKGKVNTEWIMSMKKISYSEIKATDTNLASLEYGQLISNNLH